MIKKSALRNRRVFFPLPLPGTVSGRQKIPNKVKKFTIELAKNTFLRPCLSYNLGMKMHINVCPMKKHIAMRLIWKLDAQNMSNESIQFLRLYGCFQST